MDIIVKNNSRKKITPCNSFEQYILKHVDILTSYQGGKGGGVKLLNLHHHCFLVPGSKLTLQGL